LFEQTVISGERNERCLLSIYPWAATGMGKRWLSKCFLKRFCALVFTVKRSVDELFMHYYHNLSSASGGFASRPPVGFHPWNPLGDFRPQTHNLSTPEKNPAGAHGYILVMRRFIHFITFPSEVTLIVIQRLIISQVPRILHTTSASGEFITPATWNLAHLRSFMFSCVIKVYQPVYRHLQRQCAIVEQVRYSGQVQ